MKIIRLTLFLFIAVPLMVPLMFLGLIAWTGRGIEAVAEKVADWLCVAGEWIESVMRPW